MRVVIRHPFESNLLVTRPRFRQLLATVVVDKVLKVQRAIPSARYSGLEARSSLGISLQLRKSRTRVRGN
jgi:hypothetical protein